MSGQILHQTLLLVDCGNSALKYQRLEIPLQADDEPGRLFSQLQRATITRIQNSEASTARLVSQWQGGTTYRLSWLSVGPQSVHQAVCSAFERLTEAQPPEAWRPCETVGFHKIQLRHFHNDYREPARLGADRWVAGLGVACQDMISPNEIHMVVSAGTATTIDLLQGSQDRQARFLGGWILPGLQTMDESLRRGTRDLDGLMGRPRTAQAIDMQSDVGRAAVHREIPRDSSLAISQGIGLAQTGFIYQVAQTHQVSRIWIHGGHAAAWHARLIELEKDRPNFCAIVQEIPSVCFAGLLALAQYRI